MHELLPQTTDTGIVVGGRNYSYSDIFETLQNSRPGGKLETMTRWDRYMPRDCSPKKWIDLLGDDANILYHMRDTDKIVVDFTNAENANGMDNVKSALTPQNVSMLRLTAMFHDIGEVGGDKMFDAKTSQIESSEGTFYDRMAQNIARFRTFGVAGSREFLTFLERAKSVASDKNDVLYEPFNVVERVGYFRTGMNMFSLSQTGEDKQGNIVPDQWRDNFLWGTQNVLLNQIDALLKYGKKYSYVANILKDQAGEISKAFEVTSDHMDMIDIKYLAMPEWGKLDVEAKQDKLRTYKSKFESAKRAWSEYMQSAVKQTGVVFTS